MAVLKIVDDKGTPYYFSGSFVVVMGPQDYWNSVKGITEERNKIVVDTNDERYTFEMTTTNVMALETWADS